MYSNLTTQTHIFRYGAHSYWVTDDDEVDKKDGIGECGGGGAVAGKILSSTLLFGTAVSIWWENFKQNR